MHASIFLVSGHYDYERDVGTQEPVLNTVNFHCITNIFGAMIRCLYWRAYAIAGVVSMKSFLNSEVSSVTENMSSEICFKPDMIT